MITALLLTIALSLLWRPLLIVGLLVALSMMLSGCSTTGSRVPPQLLVCKDQPSAPKSPTQRQVGLYVIDLAAAGADCRSKLNSVRGLLDVQEISK